MSRLTKLDKMSEPEKKALIKYYNQASEDSEHTPETLALVFGFSLAWLQKKRCEGGGIQFSKPTSKVVLYKKSDVTDYIEANRLKHTA